MKRKNIITTVILIVCILAAGAAAYMIWERAPETAAEKHAAAEPSPAPAAASEVPEPTPSPTPVLDNGVPPETDREDGIYTILLVGEDQCTGHTDTILVGRVDTKAHKMDFVSIPRDTLLNMDGDMRKINCVCMKAKQLERDPAEALKMRVKQLIGFDVDCYAIMQLQSFIDVIDAVGGVDYYVPVDMYIDDYWQNLYLYLPQGQYHLDGYQCMGLVRYRSGYANADLGRIDMQHDFLKACAEQFITLGNIPNAPKVVDILAKGLDTDLTAANIAFFIRQALLCDSDDINFYTMPVVGCTLGEGYSYAVIQLYDWVDMINEYLNPFNTEITSGNLSVVYKDIFGYGCTAEMAGPWYFVGAKEYEMQQAGLLP
ncbi:MAG: LCP family protein [Candidatus Limivicinus sp.]|jgi:LCP family protein required for cell wall assembly